MSDFDRITPPITGTLVYYWHICHRQVWLMAHSILPDEDDPRLVLGRFISQEAYGRNRRRELSLHGARLDLVEVEEDRAVVVEVKKSSRMFRAARLQLLYYLSRLEQMGARARGELRIPRERRRLAVDLDDEGRQELAAALAGLHEVLARPSPPPAVRIAYCRPCAYREFCWAVGDPELGETPPGMSGQRFGRSGPRSGKGQTGGRGDER